MPIAPVTVDRLAPVLDDIVAEDLNPQRDGEWFAYTWLDSLMGPRSARACAVAGSTA